jgi:hypothetical protein
MDIELEMKRARLVEISKAVFASFMYHGKPFTVAGLINSLRMSLMLL